MYVGGAGGLFDDDCGGAGASAGCAGAGGGALVAVGPLAGQPCGVSGGHVLGGLACLAGRLLRELLEDEALPFADPAKASPAAVRAWRRRRLFFLIILLLLLLLLGGAAKQQGSDCSGGGGKQRHSSLGFRESRISRLWPPLLLLLCCICMMTKRRSSCSKRARAAEGRGRQHPGARRR